MENPPVEEVFPIENGDFPMVTLVFRRDDVSNLPFKKKTGDFPAGSRRCFRSNRPGQAEEGEADVEKADLIAKDIGDHQLADEVADEVR